MTANLTDLVGIDVPTGLLIGGQWAPGGTGAAFPVIDPSNEEPLTEVADGTVEDALGFWRSLLGNETA